MDRECHCCLDENIRIILHPITYFTAGLWSGWELGFQWTLSLESCCHPQAGGFFFCPGVTVVSSFSSHVLAQLLPNLHQGSGQTHFLMLTDHLVIAVSLFFPPLPYYLSSITHWNISLLSALPNPPLCSLRICWTVGQNVPPRHTNKRPVPSSSEAKQLVGFPTERNTARLWKTGVDRHAWIFQAKIWNYLIVNRDAIINKFAQLSGNSALFLHS